MFKTKNNMNTIIFFTADLGKGGAERVLVTLANNIAEKENYKVKIALVKKQGYYLDFVDSRIEIIDFNAKGALFAFLPLVHYLKSHKRKVHLISFLGYVNVIAILATLFSGNRKSINLIVSERNHIPWGVTLKNKVIFLLQKILYKKCDSIITIAHSITNEIIEKLNVPKEKVYTIYNPISTNCKQIKDLALSKPKVPVFVSAGRLIPVKNFHMLIESFSIVREKKQCKLWIFGEGKELDNLKKHVNDKDLADDVVFWGFVDNPINYFKYADIYVCSSLSEGFGNVIIEAMMSKIKVVSTDCGGPTEILENGKWGQIVRSNSPESMASAMIEQLSKATPNYDNRLKDFSLEHIVEQYLKVLK